MAVLEGRDVTKTYREGQHEVPVLRGVSLSVERGEVVAIEGPSGSGKTTLLCILGCLLTPTSGRIVIDGQVIDANRPERLREVRRRSIGFVFQQFNLFPVADRLGERPVRPEPQGLARAGRPAARPTGCSRPSAWATARTSGPATSRAASASGSPWRGRWPVRRR